MGMHSTESRDTFARSVSGRGGKITHHMDIQRNTKKRLYRPIKKEQLKRY
jgi:hypothetical protein